MKIELVKEKQNPQELLPQIVERIFAICQNDSNFKLKEEMELIESSIDKIQRKIDKQIGLLDKSQVIKGDLIKRIRDLQNANEEKRISLLGSIGGDI